ncbi:CAP domain-containing protein [Saccharopolyspora gloriosae]|uniref:CAP domain-containing protein n=1 Tax=Saccharopolyspora gloriosae TaxID=455344 RepID=UPI001FB74B73|nr:CAP domain-containing protein [Saccharopolyspora gloriosae]
MFVLHRSIPGSPAFRRTKPILLCALLSAAAMFVPSANASRMDARTAEVVDRTNAARAEAGCGPLTPIPELERSAQAHAADMAAHDFFAHSDAAGPVLLRLLPRPGRTAENIAAGNASPAETFHQWMTSPGHRVNIQNCAYTGIGVGHAFDPHSSYGHYWVQEFTGP